VLAELHIHNFAIVDDLHLKFAPGFTVFTGETGAGKSIIIDAVGLVLGDRADTSAVRAGADQALVEAIFNVEPDRQKHLQSLLEQEGLEGDRPDTLLLSREVRAGGRNICRVNGRAVTLTVLREIVDGLVDIHGQSEHLSLLRVRSHIDLLDRYGDLWHARAEVAELVKRVRRVRRQRIELEQDEQALARRMDLLQYQISEIEAAALEPGEEEQLLDERVRLANAEQLAEFLNEGLQAIDEGDEENPAAVDQLGATVRALEGLARIDGTLEPRLREAEDLTYRLQDLAEALRDYREQIEHNPRRLAVLEDRLALIHRLKRKYGDTVAEILAYGRQAAEDLDAITHSEERIAELREEEKELLGELGPLSLELSYRRQLAAQSLSLAIERELQDLRMEGTRFGVTFEWQAGEEGVLVPQSVVDTSRQITGADGIEEFSSEAVAGVRFDATGIDRIEFLVSPNPGEPLKPLARIASGGETSRLMLALKTVLTRADETPTLIFDEIDQGIGGRVGTTVGQKLWGLTAGHGDAAIPHQVLCVTHLPQLAAFADLHLKAEKDVVDGRTLTHITPLQGAIQIEELAQMLGGSGSSAYRSAEEILEEVMHLKASPQATGAVE
jgi:DNA repair protein RecN (Recombination protein N)